MERTKTIPFPAPGAQASNRERRALLWARTGIIMAFLLLLVRPGLGHLGLAIFVIGLIQLPSLGQRLRSVLADPLPRAALLLLAVLALATTWSSAPWSERIYQLWHWRVLLLMILCLAVFDSRQWKLRLIVVIVVAGLIAAAVAGVTWAMDWRIYKVHPAGTVLREGVAQGLFFGMGAYLAAVAAWRLESLTRRQRIALTVASVVLTAALFNFSAGRSAQIAFFVASFTTILLLLRGKSRALAIAGMTTVFAVALLASPMARERLERGLNEFRTEASAAQSSSIGVRVEIWRIGAELVAERPWFGYGTGAFQGEYAKLAPRISSGWRADPKDDAHNQYLSIQVQAGLLGTLAFAVFLLSVWRQPTPMPYWVCGVAIMCGWAAVGLFFSAFEDFNEGHMVAILLGCLMARENDQPAPASSRD